VESVPKKAIARRLGVDVKTVRRALQRVTPPAPRSSPARGSRLDPWREEIVGWLQADWKVTAKRIRRLLEPLAGPVPGRTVRAYVARVRREVFPKEAFVHRTPPPGQTVEVDFGESWAEVAARLHKCKVLVATLPHSNVYFAKAYPVERLECLLDGLLAAFTYWSCPGLVDGLGLSWFAVH
jgi:transposase